MNRVTQVIASHEPDARQAGAESGSVAGGVSAARSGPQCCRRSNPAARHIRIPAREGADVGGGCAQAFAHVANFNVPSNSCRRRTSSRRSSSPGRLPASPSLRDEHIHALPQAGCRQGAAPRTRQRWCISCPNPGSPGPFRSFPSHVVSQPSFRKCTNLSPVSGPPAREGRKLTPGHIAVTMSSIPGIESVGASCVSGWLPAFVALVVDVEVIVLEDFAARAVEVHACEVDLWVLTRAAFA